MHSRKGLEEDFKSAQMLFLQGYIDHPAEMAERGYQDSSRYPDLHWRFRILLANLRIKQAKSAQALELLSASPEPNLPTEIRFHRRLVRALAFCNSHSDQEAQTELAAAKQETTPNNPNAAELQLSAARCNQALGNFKEAFAQYLSVGQSSTQDQFVKLYSLLGLGFSALKQHRYEEAVQSYLRSQSMAAALKAVPYEELARGNLGFLYFELGDLHNAMQNSQAAADLAARGGSGTHLEYWLAEVGRDHEAIGEFGLAKESYERALKIATSKGNDAIAGLCLHNLVGEELREGDLVRANQYHQQAEQLHYKQQEDLLNFRIDSAYIAAAKGEYSVAEPEFLRLISEVQDNPRLQWSLEEELARLYAKQGKREFADLWFRKGISTMEGAAAHLRETEFKIATLNSWPIFDDYIAFLYAQNESQRALQVAQLARARNLAEDLGFKPHKEHARAWVRSIEAMLRARHSVLLAYYEAEHETYAWIVTGSKFEMKALGANQNDLETLADEYRNEIDHQTPMDSSPAQKKLYRILIKPVAKLIPKNSHVILVGDSALYRINFEALISDDGPPHYWIDDVELENASSIDLLLAAGRVSRHGKGALIVGAPNQVSQQYPLLPHAREEVEDVKTQFKDADVKLFEGAAATPDAYISTQPSRFKYIEFATHSEASSSDPLKSTIILSKGPSGSFQLSAAQIVDTHPRLKADLVTISGCYSVGKVRTSAEGLLGLQWAFMRAGAHQVVAGLWDVDDQSSPQLMGGLYAGLVHGESAATALRAAKLSMVHSGKYPPAPYYWASLQLYTGL
jgi:CHAT domain-containing protein